MEFLPIILIIVAACVVIYFLAKKYPDTPKEINELQQNKKCQYCAELINYEAKVCKHCRRNVSGGTSGSGCAIVFACIFVIAGIFFWPLWIVAVLLFILGYTMDK